LFCFCIVGSNRCKHVKQNFFSCIIKEFSTRLSKCVPVLSLWRTQVTIVHHKM
jgi:hypothetical protein